MDIDSGSAAQVDTPELEQPVAPEQTSLSSSPPQTLTNTARPSYLIATACIAAYLIPGAGHLVLGKWKRAAVLFLAVTLMFWLGLRMYGHIFIPVTEDWLSFFPAFANAGAGLLYLGAWASGIGLMPADALQAFNQAGHSSFEYGNTFLMVAGLINYLLILDVFDIAAGRKQ